MILTSAKIDESMSSRGIMVLNRKFLDYSVIAYRFVATFFQMIAFSDLTPLKKPQISGLTLKNITPHISERLSLKVFPDTLYFVYIKIIFGNQTYFLLFVISHSAITFG